MCFHNSGHSQGSAQGPLDGLHLLRSWTSVVRVSILGPLDGRCMLWVSCLQPAAWQSLCASAP